MVMIPLVLSRYPMLKFTGPILNCETNKKTKHAAVRGQAFTFAAFAVFALATITLLATLAHAILSQIPQIQDRELWLLPLKSESFWIFPT